MSNQTKFEADLQKYFPDIYEIHTLNKFDRNIWEVWKYMLEMLNNTANGKIEISYDRGKIDKISYTQDVLRYSSQRPYHNVPGKLE